MYSRSNYQQLFLDTLRIALSLLLLVTTSSAQKELPRVGDKATPPKKVVLLSSLEVFSQPPGASIYINGQLKGQTGVDGYLSKALSFKEGVYTVTLSYPDYQDYTQKVELRAGKLATVKANLSAKWGYLLLDNLMPDTSIIIDAQALPSGQATSDSSGELKLKLSKGKHTLELRKPGYQNFSKDLEITDQVFNLSAKLAPQTKAIVIKSLAGANVYINNNAQGLIPSEGQLTIPNLALESHYQLTIEKAGFEKFSQDLYLSQTTDTLVSAILKPLPTSSEFVDNFVNGLNFWQAPSSWTVAQGLLHVMKSKEAGLPKDKYYRDSEIVFGLRLVDNKGAAWVVHAQDSQNFYLFCLNGSEGRYPNKLQTYICQDGHYDLNQPVSIALPIVPPLQVGVDYRINIKVVGNVIEQSITPATTGERVSLGLFRDDKTLFSGGGFGFIAPDGEDFQIHGLVITPLLK